MYDILLIEGINDPGIFKAVFTAGGPGSGKSTAANDLGLFALGLRPINSDTAFEKALKKNDIPLKLNNMDPELRDTMRVKAKQIAGKQLDLALKGRLGLVIDSTARDVNRIIKQKKDLEKLGYETAMVFVDTELETALARNAARARTVPENIVRSSHATISKNRDKLKSIFGASRFFVIHNDGDLSDLRKNTNRMFSKVSGWVNKKVMNKQAKDWKSQFEALQEAKAIREAKLDLVKNKKNVDLFGNTLASLVKTKYDPDNPIDSIDATFKKIRNGRWSPKQWANIHKMAQGLKGLGIELKSLKGMYMGMDKSGNMKFYEELEAVFEIDRRNPAKRNIAATRVKLEAHEKQMLKKMMAKPKDAIRELTVTIAFFKKQVAKALPLVQPIIKAQIIKFEAILAQIEAAKNVTEAGVVVGAIAGAGTSSTSIPSGPGSVVVKRDSSFAGNAVFDCDPKTFSRCITGKKKHKRWASFLDDKDPFYNKMKTWMSQSYKNKNFIMRNKQTGEMAHARNVMGENLDEAIPKSMIYGLFDRKTGEIVVKGSKAALAKKQKEMGGPKKFGIVNAPSAKVGDVFKSNNKMFKESIDALPLTKKEENTFKTGVKKFKGLTAIGNPTMTNNVLNQDFRVAEGLKRDKIAVQMSKEPDNLSKGMRYYDIRLVKSAASSAATQSQKFVQEEKLNILKSELTRFSTTILKKHLMTMNDSILEVTDIGFADLQHNKALKPYMNDPLYKAILQAKSPADLKKAMKSASSIRGASAIKNFQKVVKALM